MDAFVPVVLPNDKDLLARLTAYSIEKGRRIDDTVNKAMALLASLSDPRDRPVYAEPDYIARGGRSPDGRSAYVITLEAGTRKKFDDAAGYVTVARQSLGCLMRYCETRSVQSTTALLHGLTLLEAADKGCLWIEGPNRTMSKVTIVRQ